jgi:predicted site-specific integrase-resolvase
LDTPESTVDRWLMPATAAGMIGCDPRSLANWARAGKLNTQRTLGGHRRYRESEIRALIADRAEVAA